MRRENVEARFLFSMILFINLFPSIKYIPISSIIIAEDDVKTTFRQCVIINSSLVNAKSQIRLRSLRGKTNQARLPNVACDLHLRTCAWASFDANNNRRSSLFLEWKPFRGVMTDRSMPYFPKCSLWRIRINSCTSFLKLHRDMILYHFVEKKTSNFLNSFIKRK